MSDLELEQAAIAPHRWIDLCGGFKKRIPGDFQIGGSEILSPRTTRIIRDATMLPVSSLFLVPGGRYLVVVGNMRLFVWDLGYVSSAYCTLIASVRLESGHFPYDLNCIVQATPDDMGLIILVYDSVE